LSHLKDHDSASTASFLMRIALLRARPDAVSETQIATPFN
jgi:hypothetical protein